MNALNFPKEASMEEKIQFLFDWVDSIPDKKFDEYFISSFKTIANANRWMYVWQWDAVTHEKYLQFLVMLQVLFKRRKYDVDTPESLVNFFYQYFPLESTSVISFNFALKVYKNKSHLLPGIKLKLGKIKGKELMNEFHRVGIIKFSYRDYEYSKDIYDTLKKIDWSTTRHDFRLAYNKRQNTLCKAKALKEFKDEYYAHDEYLKYMD